MSQVSLYSTFFHQRIPGAVEATLVLNPQHAIFQGHFPQQPLLPGVCMVQMVQQTLEEALSRAPLRLLRASQVKFLSFVDPSHHPEVSLAIQYQSDKEGIKVRAQLSHEETIFFKFVGRFS